MGDWEAGGCGYETMGALYWGLRRLGRGGHSVREESRQLGMNECVMDIIYSLKYEHKLSSVKEDLV